MSRSHGQSIAEYVLPISLVAVISMIILLTLPGLMNQFISNTNKGQATQNSVNINPLGALPDGSLPSAVNPNDNATTLTLRLRDGTLIVLENFPKNLSDLLDKEDPGTGMATLSLQIKALAEKMRSRYTQEQYESMIALADQGFRMAAIQQEIDRVLKEQNLNLETLDPATQNETLAKLMITTPEGKAISLKEALDSFRFSLNGKSDLSTLTPGDLKDPNLGTELRGFLQRFMGAFTSGALKEGPVLRLVNYLVFRISSLGQFVANHDSTAEMQTKLESLGNNRLTKEGTGITCQDASGGECSI